MKKSQPLRVAGEARWFIQQPRSFKKSRVEWFNAASRLHFLVGVEGLEPLPKTREKASPDEILTPNAPLSADECRLIQAFRRLSADDQQRVIELAKSLQ